MLAALAASLATDPPIADRLLLCRKDLDQQLQARRWSRYAAMITARSTRNAMPQPRQYPDPAASQRAYRARQTQARREEQQAKGLPPDECPRCRLAAAGLPWTAG